MGVLDRLKHAWNSFIGEDSTQTPTIRYDLGYSSNYRPDKVRFSRGNERSIVTSIYNRMSIDVSVSQIKHVLLDKDARFSEIVNSGLNECLTVQANKDQQSRQFIQDIVMSLFDEGCIAVVPIDTSVKVNNPGGFDILTMRTAKILMWYPDHIQVEVYNDRIGVKQTLLIAKSCAAIIENPYYSVMNEQNSVLQRLIRKLNILDAIDEQSGSGKLDLIIQLPYIIKTEARRSQAEARRLDMEQQLASSKYGIAYTDGTEKVTQLNRAVENDLLKQIEYLTSMLFGQLGINSAILDGSADEKVMLNYMNRTIEPIISAITLEFNRKFLTESSRKRGETIKYFTNPFRLVTVTSLAEIADKFTRNEVLSSNEVRDIIGFRPVLDPRANELSNKNLNPVDESKINSDTEENSTKSDTKDGENQNG